MAKIIRVDMTHKTIDSEAVPDKYALLGGEKF